MEIPVGFGRRGRNRNSLTRFAVYRRMGTRDRSIYKTESLAYFNPESDGLEIAISNHNHLE